MPIKSTERSACKGNPGIRKYIYHGRRQGHKAGHPAVGDSDFKPDALKGGNGDPASQSPFQYPPAGGLHLSHARATHVSKNTSASHLNKFYVTFESIRRKRFDGMIITGAPVENLEYEEVNYWEELSVIMEWSKTHVTSTLHICWGAQAGLYYHYGIPKYSRESKLSGIYNHRVLDRKVPLVRSLNDTFLAPHSRYTECRREDIRKHPELMILAESDEAGIFLVMSRDGRQIFVQGHPEYDRMTLNNEYHRDLKKGLDPALPCNYYENNDPFSIPALTWRNTSNTLYTNWLNFYVYQITPYLLDCEE